MFISYIIFTDDLRLPSVPPILITVPYDYPDNSPECSTHRNDYGKSTTSHASKPFYNNNVYWVNMYIYIYIYIYIYVN